MPLPARKPRKLRCALVIAGRLNIQGAGIPDEALGAETGLWAEAKLRHNRDALERRSVRPALTDTREV